MANHSEALQIGFFTAQEAINPKSVASQNLRYKNEKVANKQEFAKTYSYSLDQRSRSASKHGEKLENHSTAKPDRTKPVKQQSLNAANRPRHNTLTRVTDAAKSGRTLPQNEDPIRQATTSPSSTSANKDSVASGIIGEEFTQGQTVASSAVSSENTYDSLGELVFAFGELASTSESVHVSPNGSDEIAAAMLRDANVDSDTETATPPQIKSAQLLPTHGSVSQSGQLYSPPSNAMTQSQPTPAMENSSQPQNAALLSSVLVAELNQAQDPTGAKTNSNEAIWRSAADESVTKFPHPNTAKLNYELSRPNQASTEVFASLNSGTQGQQEDSDAQQPLKQETLLSKERWFALVQQSNSQNQGTTSVSSFELNKILGHQTAQLTNDDQAHSEIITNGAKEIVPPSRLFGSSLQMLSPMLQMSSAFGHKGWSSEVGQRVLWMVNTQLQQAQLQLNPKHLGPIEIKITMTADQQVNVNFLTHSSAVKEALDQAMPRLREVFDQSGLNLNNVNVQQESHNQHHHHSADDEFVEPAHVGEKLSETDSMAQIFHRQSLSSNIVDFYA